MIKKQKQTKSNIFGKERPILKFKSEIGNYTGDNLQEKTQEESVIQIPSD
jgi:hypothetical protein